MMTMTLAKIKFLLLLLLIAFILPHSLFADEWVLGAREFEYQHYEEGGNTQSNLSVLIPQLILEQIALGLNRTTSYDEMLGRALEKNLTDRISLFLQLSKEVKTRDAIVLYGYNPVKQNKLINEQNKKIDDVKKNIDKNLLINEQLKQNYLEKTAVTEEYAKGKMIINPFSMDFYKKIFLKDEKAKIDDVKNETVVFYKKDTTALFKQADNIVENSPLSPEYERKVLKEKINGLITGSFVIYSDYISVTCSLYSYPGRTHVASVTEIGSLSDQFKIAGRIAEYFVPYITNNLPIEVYFDVTPEFCSKNVRLTLDGSVYKTLPEKIVLNSGSHSLSLDCDGYISQTRNFDFKDHPKFIIKSEMVEEKLSQMTFTVLSPVPGSVYAQGQLVSSLEYGNPTANIITDGNFVVGAFQTEQKYTTVSYKMVENDKGEKKPEKVESDGGNLTFFYTIPPKIQQNGVSLGVKGKAIDTDSYIDKRRKWSYRAYSLLVLSMPYTLYSVGKYNSAVIAYNDKRIGMDEVEKYEMHKNISYAITGTCAAFFVVELVRYLISANSVLPHKTKIINKADIDKAVSRSYKTFPVPQTEDEIQSVTDIEQTEEVSETGAGTETAK